MHTRLSLLLLMLLSSATVMAGDSDSTSTAKKQNFVVSGVMWVKTLIDSMAVNGIDRSYIEQPKRPWAIEVRTQASQSTLKMTSDWDFGSLGGKGSMTARSDNGFSTSVGAWLGYRGYGFGLSKELTHGDGSTLSFGAMGGSFGINFRINTYRSKQPDLQYYIDDGEEQDADRGQVDLDDPIHVRSLFLDGYYMFNGKHFSYAAAYDQSLIQRRSAGSLVAGAMYYHSSVDYADVSNWPLVALMNNVGKVKFSQASVGVGYAYNWVPARGWLVSVMGMPMLTFYNKMKVYRYRVEYMGGSILDMEDFDEDLSHFNLTDLEENKTNNRVGWNFDARLSVVYNWSRYYLRVYGHYNRFRYSNDSGFGRMVDWTGYASLGFRF